MNTALQFAQVGSSATFIQTVVKALALGSVYVLIALGFVIIFKATQVLNFAAGALSMAGAMFMTILVADGGLPFLPFDNPFGVFQAGCHHYFPVTLHQSFLRREHRGRRKAHGIVDNFTK